MYVTKPPRYLINPLAMKKAAWFPDGLWGVTNKYQNPNRMNSLWLGTFWNIFHTPIDAGVLAINHLKRLDLSGFFETLFYGFLTLIQLFVSGVRGELLGFDLSFEIMSDGVVLIPEHAAKLPADYAGLLVIDTQKIL